MCNDSGIARPTRKLSYLGGIMQHAARLRPYVVVAAIAVAACGDKVEVVGDMTATALRAGKLADKQSAARQAPPTAPQLQFTSTDQKLIRTAELRIEVEDLPGAMLRADSIARRRDALIADSRITQYPNERRDATIVIRVPSSRFDETVTALRGSRTRRPAPTTSPRNTPTS
jgi:hypothetical protein